MNDAAILSHITILSSCHYLSELCSRTPYLFAYLFQRCSRTQSYHDPIIMHINYGASLSHYLSESWSRTDLKYRPILIVCRNNVAALSHHLSEICSRTHYLLNDAAVLSHVTIVSVRYTLIVSYH